jgi:hypothetical protein
MPGLFWCLLLYGTASLWLSATGDLPVIFTGVIAMDGKAAITISTLWQRAD